MLEIEQRRQRAHALAHVLVVAGDVLHLVEEFFGEEVRIRVDPHLRPSSFRCSVCGFLASWSRFRKLEIVLMSGGRALVTCLTGRSPSRGALFGGDARGAVPLELGEA